MELDNKKVYKLNNYNIVIQKWILNNAEKVDLQNPDTLSLIEEIKINDTITIPTLNLLSIHFLQGINRFISTRSKNRVNKVERLCRKLYLEFTFLLKYYDNGIKNIKKYKKISEDDAIKMLNYIKLSSEELMNFLKYNTKIGLY